MRAGRPRSRVGILYTLNRKQGLHPAQESGKKSRAGLENHSPLEGESVRQGLCPQSNRWGGRNRRDRQMGESARGRAGGGPTRRPARTRPGATEEIRFGAILARMARECRGWEAVCRNKDAGGTPALPGGHPLHVKPQTGFTSCPGIGQEVSCRPRESLPPGGGVGEARALPAVEPVGGTEPAGSPDGRVSPRSSRRGANAASRRHKAWRHGRDRLWGGLGAHGKGVPWMGGCLQE